MRTIEKLIQIDTLLGKILKVLNNLDYEIYKQRGVSQNYLHLFLELEQSKDWLIEQKEQLLEQIKKENKNLYITLYKKCLRTENILINKLLDERRKNNGKV